MDGPTLDIEDPMAHPDPEALAAFGLGRLDEREAETIAEHVSSCDACRSVVESAGDDTMALLLRAASSGRPTAQPDDVVGPPSGYERMEVIGEGGMGVVYRARQRGLGRVVALKQVRPEALGGRDAMARFRREAEAAARLRHPNIVPIYDVGRLDGVPYLAMEYVEGGTLAARLAGGPLDPRAAARLVELLARAVQHAHEAGVIHRDLKPANVLLAPDLDCPKVADFGLARSDGNDLQTRTGTILGTPGYMAPEQAEGDSSRVGPPCDIHALGAIFYETLTGRPPFSNPSVLATLELVRTAQPSSPRRVRPGVPRDLETVALKCLEKSPSKRYDSARALAEDLRRWLDGEPIRARRIGLVERLGKWARRRPWAAACVGLGVLAAMALVVGTMAHNALLRAEVARTEKQAKEARDQRARADSQYRSARDAIRKMTARLGGPATAGGTDSFALKRGLVEDALAFYDGAVTDDGRTEFEARLDKARALEEIATLQIMASRGDPERTLLRDLALLDDLEIERPHDPVLAEVQVSCRIKLGVMLGGAGRLDEAIARIQGAVERSERRTGTTVTLAWALSNLGNMFLAAHRIPEAEAQYHRAVGIWLARIREHPDDFASKVHAGESLCNLGVLHMQAGQSPLAEDEYALAADLLAPVTRDHPELDQAVTSLGAVYLNWGTLTASGGRRDLAIGRYETGLRTLRGVLRATPDHPWAREGSRKLATAMGVTLGQVGRYPESARALGQAASFAEGSIRRDLLLIYAAALARADLPDRAMAEAEEVETSADDSLSADDLYNLACVASLASASARSSGHPGEADRLAARAIAWLERCLAPGVSRTTQNLANFDADPDLDPLRQRDDFRALRLDAAFPADPFARSR
jgi:eukaryotic-like serine/threonine-protein kinase